MPRITILTHADGGTLGDPSSAAKLQKTLINQFKQQGRDIEVDVIVDVHTTENKQAVKNLFKTYQYEFIDGFDRDSGGLTKSINDSDLIILYPTPHYLSVETKTMLAKTKKIVISLVEYDYLIYHTVEGGFNLNPVFGSPYLTSGIGEKSLGIYINDIADQQTASRDNLFNQLHPDDRNKLPDDLDPAMYFGYFNKQLESYSGATPARFIALATYLNPEQKQVDVVIPLQPLHSHQIDPENKVDILLQKQFVDDLKDFNKVVLSYFYPPSTADYFIYQRTGNQFVVKQINEEEFEENKMNSDKVIRIINPFPLQPQSMQALIQNSEPLSIATGDQSFSEALSQAKILFYQAMGWKQHLYHALTLATKNYTTLHTWLMMISQSGKQSTSIKTLADFYRKNKDALQKETLLFRSNVVEKKNLSINVMNYINSLMGKSLFERYQIFMDNFIENPKFYAQVKRRYDQDNDEADNDVDEEYVTYRYKTLFSHLDFYLQDAAPDEKEVMVADFMEKVQTIRDLPELIHDAGDFSSVLAHLFSPEQRTAVYEKMKDRLSEFIQDAGDFRSVLKYLAPEQRTEVYEKMKMEDRLHSLIKSAGDFRSVLKYLAPERRTEVYEKMKMEDRLHSLIKSAGDFRSVLKYLAPERRTEVYEKMKMEDRLHSLIENAADFHHVLQFLSLDQCRVVCQAIQDILPKLIQRSYDLVDVLKGLTPEKCIVVCQAVQDKDILPKIIENAHDLVNVLKKLTPKQCMVVCQAIQGILPKIIENAHDLVEMLKEDLTPEQCMGVCQTVIKRVADFKYVLKQRSLSIEKRTAVCEGMLGHLPGLIKRASDFSLVFKFLSPEQRTEVYEKMKDHLRGLIDDVDDFNDVLKFLSPEQRTEVYEKMKDHLRGLIDDVGDFNDVLKFLSPEQRTDVYGTMKDRLPEFIISSPYTYQELELTPAQHLEVSSSSILMALEQCKLSINNKPYQHDVLFPNKNINSEFKAIETLQRAIQGENTKLAPHVVNTLIDILSSSLGETAQELIKNGVADRMFDHEVKTVNDFVQILSAASITPSQGPT